LQFGERGEITYLKDTLVNQELAKETGKYTSSCGGKLIGITKNTHDYMFTVYSISWESLSRFDHLFVFT